MSLLLNLDYNFYSKSWISGHFMTNMYMSAYIVKYYHKNCVKNKNVSVTGPCPQEIYKDIMGNKKKYVNEGKNGKTEGRKEGRKEGEEREGKTLNIGLFHIWSNLLFTNHLSGIAIPILQGSEQS